MGAAASMSKDIMAEDLTHEEKAARMVVLKKAFTDKSEEVARRKSLDDQQKEAHLYDHMVGALKDAFRHGQTPSKSKGSKDKGENNENENPVGEDDDDDDDEDDGQQDAVNAAQLLASSLSMGTPDAQAMPARTTASKGKPDFRKRRLTYASQRAQSRSELPVDLPSNMIFASGEMGEQSVLDPPFSAAILGTYSCHGIEPSWEDENEVCAKTNQDRGCVVFPFMGDAKSVLCCVFDGHGEHGDAISNFSMLELPQRLTKHPKIITDPAQALKETFVEVDRALTSLGGDTPVYSGSTAIAILIRGNHMWIANAGDSRAVLARKVPSPTGPQAGDKKTAALQAIPLTQDHNPDKDSEKLRIEASGGFVSPPPEPGLSARVWLDADMTQVGLAMARSIGDHVVKEAGVIAEPEIFERDIEPEDKFVVMASDGIWEFLPNEKVVKIINRELKKEGDRSAMTACESLITSAAKRWQQEEGGYRDDITAVLLRLPCFS